MTRHNTERQCNSDCWYPAKRKGKRVRWRNRCTGAWDNWSVMR